MQKLTTDPLSWISGAIGNTASAILLWYLSFCYGVLSVSTWDEGGWWFSPIVLIISLFTGWGIIFIPLACWILWALIFEAANPYILLSVNILLAALTLVFLDTAYIELYPHSLPMLLPVVFLLRRAWQQPLKKFHSRYAVWKKENFPDSSLNPLDWLTSAIGHTFTAILLTGFTFLLGYFTTADDFSLIEVSWCGVYVPELISSGAVVLLFPLFGWILWSAVFQLRNPYVLYAINLLCGACIGYHVEGYFSSSWYSLPLLFTAAYILFTAILPALRKGIGALKARKYRGIEFDEDSPPIFRLPSKSKNKHHG